MQANWVDLLIVAIVIYALIDGWRRGLLVLLANLISFLASLWLAVRYHGIAAGFLTTTFGLTSAWTTVSGYMIVGLLSQLVIETIVLALLTRLPSDIFASRANVWLGSVVSSVNALIVTAFVFLLVLALPLRGTIRQDVRQSVLGMQLVRLAETYGGRVRSSVEELAQTATKFMTVQPGSQESIRLDIPQNWSDLAISPEEEREMVRLVNEERTSRGFEPLTVHSGLTAVAEEKSRDMFKRQYFSHYDPDGRNASDRADAAGITYGIIGENLAYAPDLGTAHQGLMDSPGHRENILEPRYRNVGIGVIDGGIYGKMYTQLFID